MVFIELGAARGIVAFLGNADIIGLSTFAVNLLVLLAIAAGTDYAIFLDRALSRGSSVRRGSKTRATTRCFMGPRTSSWARA